jgi:type I restriction enzyme S subunit
MTAAAHDRPLPPGWRWVRLGEVVSEAQTGFATGERDDSGVIQLRMNNVDTMGHIRLDEFIRVPVDRDTVTKYALRPGDVMFNNTNSVELVGKSALFTGHTEPIVYSNHFTRLRVAEDRCVADYLAAWLLNEWLSKTFEKVCNRWIGQSAVKSDILLSLVLPLPPLAEQRRIAAVLNEQLAAVDRARAAIEAQLAEINALPAAILRQAFRGEL